MKYAPIVPAFIPASREQVVHYASELSFSPEIQLDLVDGNFVEAVSWPYQPKGDALSVKSALATYTLEVDLMVSEPLPAARAWLAAGADRLVFHIETISLEAFESFADHTANISFGVSAHGETTLDQLSLYAEAADYIQLMGIREIGAQGLPFDETVLEKVAELKKRFPHKEISVDGSVNKNTIVRLYQAGVDRFVCGSAIVLQPDPHAAYQELSALINQWGLGGVE